MKQSTARCMAVATLLALSVYAPGTRAADCANPRKAAGGMTEGVYRGVEEATRLITQKKNGEAISKLDKLAETGSDFEKAVVYYNLGFAHSSKDDHANAAKAFASALALNALPQTQHEQLQYNLGQLYVVAGLLDDGIRTLQEYVAQACSAVPPEAHIFLSNALSQRKRYREALPQIDLALSKAKAPKESWLQLKLAIQYELKEHRGCAQTLVQLIALVPDKAEYWKQLSSMLYEMKDDAEALAVLVLAERQGFIDEPQEIRNLYSIYMLLDLPFKAGLLMEESLAKGRLPADEKNLESLADAWINARETARAEAALRKLAAQSERGQYFFKLGAMFGDEERWQDSREMLQKALDKGGLKRTGEAWMRLAVAHYNLEDVRSARSALQKALSYDESRKQAGEWLRHLSGQQTAEQASVAAAPAG